MNTARQRRQTDGAIMFLTGALTYTMVELLWRGYSHWTMTVTGGACALLVHAANVRMRRAPIAVRCVAGGCIITAVELAVGCVVNLLLGWQVWDYTAMPLDLFGQICLPYSVCWVALSLPCIMLSNWLTARRAKESMIFERQ